MSLQKFEQSLINLPVFAKNYLLIHSKLGGARKFVMNRAQLYAHDRIETQLKDYGRVRCNILKGRQQGMSTYVQSRYFHKILTQKGKKAFILTHLASATANIFEMAKRFSEGLEPGVFPQPDKNNDNTLTYDCLGSGYRVGTAGNEHIGRSMTNQYLHLSEYAFYKKAESISLGLLQTVGENVGTEVIKESTANGVNNDFYHEWTAVESGKSRYQNIFVPWYWQDEYCLQTPDFELDAEEREILQQYEPDGMLIGHLNWRRIILQDFKGTYEQKVKKFRQEYPLTPLEAFINSITNTFLTVDCVAKARKTYVDYNSNLILGVDPARSRDGSGDRTAIIRRRGRKAYGLETHYVDNAMKLVDIIANIIRKENPAKVYIDGIGMGGPIVDRLQELGFDCVEGVIVSNEAIDSARYANMRAELWDKMRDWLTQEMPVEIPDSDELQIDLTGLMELEDRRRRMLVESKKDAKKRGIPSPDTADALKLTFYGGEYASHSAYVPRTISERAARSLI